MSGPPLKRPPAAHRSPPLSALTSPRTRAQVLALAAVVAVAAGAAPAGADQDPKLADAAQGEARARGLFTWGNNNAGQLGLGHLKNLDRPDMVPTFSAKKIVAVAAGGDDESLAEDGFSLALTEKGRLYAFGCNTFGQLGLGDEDDRTSMVEVLFPGNATARKVAKIQAGSAFALAVTADGKLFSWGRNNAGQLGHGDQRDRPAPALVEALADHEVHQVSVGKEHVIAITKDGLLFVWGSNSKGQLGVGQDIDRRTTPVQLQGAITGIKFVSIAAGYEHTLAASRSGEIYCWGANGWGQLGLGDLEDRNAPHAVLHRFTRAKVVAVAGGARHSVALTDASEVFTWGSNDCGQLGYTVKGGKKFVGYPHRQQSIKARKITAGHSTSMATLSTGRVFVWGCNNNGELGLGDAAARSEPELLPHPFGTPLTLVSLGANHALAANKRGEMVGWGKNSRGQLGLAYTTKAERKPTLVSSFMSEDVVGVATGGYSYEYMGQTIAVTRDRKVFSWGWNAMGQLGLGTLDQGLSTPHRLFDLEKPMVVHQLSCGQSNCAAIVSKRRQGAYTWGPNFHGQLGHRYLDLGPILSPSRIDSIKNLKLKQISVGHCHMLALTEKGDLHVWGCNTFGQLGTGDLKDRIKPTLLNTFGGVEIVYAEAGEHSSYAIGRNGKVFAWGYNENFELGLGEGINRNAPQWIQGLEGTNVTAVVAGAYHAFAVTVDGRVAGWGNNEFGQVGVGHTDVVKAPQFVEGLPPLAEVQSGTYTMGTMGAGTWHTAAVAEDGKVYTWGRNDFGQLGHGDSRDRHAPELVREVDECKAVGIAVAGNHNILVAYPSAKWTG